jgi:hypothetical protein
MSAVETTTNIDTNRFGIPTGFAPMDFDMDPSTEDLIRGNNLQPGMIVLVEAITVREDPSDHIDNADHVCEKYKCARLKSDSQWCMVTDLQKRGDLTTFIGLYADGTKRSRTYNQSYCWFVKKVTI